MTHPRSPTRDILADPSGGVCSLLDTSTCRRRSIMGAAVVACAACGKSEVRDAPRRGTPHNVAMVGETLSRYRLVAHLGSGAMGDVYRAEDERLRRTVALKVVRAARDPEETSRRLLAEARAGSAFTHPNIAVVYEADEVEHDGATLSFIAMEYVAGRTLADLASQSPLTLDFILDVGRQVADALAA